MSKNEKEIIDFYRETKDTDKRKQGPLYEYFINSSGEISTISYSKCISLFCDLYCVGTPYKISFEHLNNVRNTLMHLGINYKDEYYFLIGCISRILQYLEFEILPQLDKRISIVEDVKIKIFFLGGKLTEIEEELWKDMYKDSIVGVVKLLRDAFLSKEIQTHLTGKRKKIELLSTIDMKYSYASMTVEDEDFDEEAFSLWYETISNSLVFSSSTRDSIVFAVFPISNTMDLSATDFYSSKNLCGVQINNIDHQDRYWLKSEHKDQFIKQKLCIKCIEVLLKKMIDFCDDMF